jgi:hypothetical protein
VNCIVSVSKRVKTNGGLRYCPVVVSANGRIKPDAVIVDGREELHPEGSYYLNWYTGKRRMRLSVGKDAATATARRHALRMPSTVALVGDFETLFYSSHICWRFLDR